MSCFAILKLGVGFGTEMRKMNRGLAAITLAFAVLVFSHPAAQAADGAGQAAPAVKRTSVGASHTVQRLAAEPEVRSSAVLVMDPTDSSILYSRRAHIAKPIASITKLMTALVVLEAEQPLDEVLEITKADTSNGKGEYSRIAVGAKITRGDLMHLSLMSSENRAAHALGRNFPGGMQAFVRAMNAKAKSLGMTTARFVEPTGLSSQNVASPADLSKLVVAASNNELVRSYSTDKRYTVKVGRQLLEFRNTNPLVTNPGWEIALQKTGYISEAGRCLVMQAVIEGRTVVIVLLNSVGKYTRVADAKRIRKWLEARLLQESAERTVAVNPI